MANPKWKEWTDPDKLILLEGWARDGLTDEQIAHNMGIAPSTYYEWKKAHKEISESVKKGKEVVDFMVENALLQSALEGNITAQIFWLKNRKRNKWRDKVEEVVDETNDNTGVIQITPINEVSE